MKRPHVFLCVLATLSSALSPAHATVCALDVVPARTLLLPYFEVDLSKLEKPKKAEVTTVTLTNHYDGETLVHVTLWTDLVGPVVAWDIPIPPFGSQDVPLHEIYRGDITTLPGLSPGANVAPPGVTTEDVIARQTGEPIDGSCFTFPRGDNVARGYATFDVASTGNEFPNLVAGDPPNVLTGVVTYSNRRKKYGAQEYLVHLEEGEGLGSVWAVDYNVRSGSKTELIVWRGPETNEEGPDFEAVCEGPSENGWYPLNQMEVTVAAEDGTLEEILVDGFGDGIPGFPLATGRYQIGKGDLQVPFNSGTVYLDLSNSPNSWVGVRRSFSSGKRQGRSQAIPVVPVQCFEE